MSRRVLSASLLFLLLAAASLAKAELRIQAGYSEAADLFSLLDNLSLWSPDGFSEPEYREYWTAAYGWDSEDQACFLVPLWLFLVPQSLFLIPQSLFLIPQSLFLVPQSLFLVPQSLFLVHVCVCVCVCKSLCQQVLEF